MPREYKQNKTQTPRKKRMRNSRPNRKLLRIKLKRKLQMLPPKLKPNTKKKYGKKKKHMMRNFKELSNNTNWTFKKLNKIMNFY